MLSVKTNSLDSIKENKGIIDNVESETRTDKPVLKSVEKLIEPSEDESDLSMNQARLFPFDLIGGAVNFVKNATSSLINVIKAPTSEAIKNAETLSNFASRIKSSYIKNDRTRPEDPYQDISDYLKHKHSDDLKIDAIGALRTRESLKRIFASTKDEDLHKYGSNYNVLVPNTQYVGLIRNFLDGLRQ